MKLIQKRNVVLLSMFVMFCGSCFNAVYAKLTSPLGEALCKPSTSAIQQAKDSFNSFRIGQSIDLSPTSGLTKVMRVEKTIGKVHGHTVIKAGFVFDTYLNELRGLHATAGKTFEESFRRSFNNMMTRQNSTFFAETTAALGNPHDSADLLIIDKKTINLECKVQQKLSAKEAVKAILDDKYSDCVILVPSDQLEPAQKYIKKHLNNYSLEDQNKLQEALKPKMFGSVKSCKLTDNILGVQSKSVGFYEEATRRMYTRTFKNISDKMVSTLSRAIRNGEDIINTGNKLFRVDEAIRIYRASNVIKPEIEAALRSAQFTKFVRVGNTVVGIAGSIIDIGYGAFMLYNAESQFQKGLLDADLSNYKKTLGIVQIGVGVIGLVMLFSPDPFSKIAAPIVVVVGVLVAALDMWIDYIQAQRIAARQRLIERIDTKEHPDAVHKWLIREMNIQCAL